MKKTAAPDNLYIVHVDCVKPSMEASASFHTIVAKILYVSRQARWDTSLNVAFLTTRVRAPATYDWEKVSHLMEYLRGDKDQSLVLGGKNNRRLMCYVNASLAVHPKCTVTQEVDWQWVEDLPL